MALKQIVSETIYKSGFPNHNCGGAVGYKDSGVGLDYNSCGATSLCHLNSPEIAFFHLENKALPKCAEF